MTSFNSSQFDTFTFRTHPRGEFVKRTLAAAFRAVDPGDAVKRYLNANPLPSAKRIFVFGLGKAACAMTQAAADFVDPQDTLVITKHASPLDLEPVTVILGDHPIPGESSLRAGNAALDFLSQLTEDDLLLCLISGGGSALMTSPLVPLDDLQVLTSALLRCGATIAEINTLRRHLDRLKGGGLARHANGAQIISLILSDVVGNSLEAIASGPTAPASTTQSDAIAIIEKYDLHEKIPSSIIPSLGETLKPDNPVFKRVHNSIIASNLTALEAIQKEVGQEGFKTKILNTELQGEAREVGRKMASTLKSDLESMRRPFCLLAGGETTVTIQGNGKGGRNQETVLGAVDELAGLKDVLLISIATDGEDGPTDAAGAAAMGESAQRAESLGVFAADYLSGNDAYSYFDKLGDLIKTGPSGTNVNDLIIAFAF